MTVPVRMQLSRRKGFRLPPTTVNVARPGKWGNPYRIGEPVDMKQARRWGWKLSKPDYVCDTAAEAVKRFTLAIAFDDASKWVMRQELRGKNVACWCGLCPAHAAGKPMGVVCPDCDPCHGDPILECANA